MSIRIRLLVYITIPAILVLFSLLGIYWYIGRLTADDHVGHQMVAEAAITSEFVAMAENDAHLTREELQARLHRVVTLMNVERGLHFEFCVTDETGTVVVNTGGYNFQFSNDPKKNPQAYVFWPLLQGSKRCVVQEARQREVDPQIFKYAGVRGVDKPRIVQVGYKADSLMRVGQNRLLLGTGLFVLLAGTWVLTNLLLTSQVVRPLGALTKAVSAFEADNFIPNKLESLHIRKDEVGALSRVFVSMAEVVGGRHKQLVDSMGSVVLRLDQERIIQFANPAVQYVLGYAPTELIGKSINIIIPPEEQVAIAERMDEMSHGGVLNDKVSFNVHKDGHQFRMMWSYSPLLGPGGGSEFLYIGRSIEEFERLREEKEAANELNQKLNRLLNHDVRTIFSPIPGYVENFLNGSYGELTTKQNERLKSIGGACQDVLRLLDDSLILDKIENGVFQLHVSPFDPAIWIQKSLAMYEPAFDRENIKLEPEVEEQLPRVLGDEIHCKRILENLLSNAVKFTPKGGKVVIRVARDGLWLRVEVRDNGKGIDPEERHKLFTPYGQTKENGNQQGVGLGLHSAKTLVELHRGMIGCDENPDGQGALFWFTLPLEHVEDPRALRAYTGVVLVADDYPPQREAIGDELQQAGFEVHFAENGQQAVAMCKQYSPGVVILDIDMPVMTGFEAVKQIRVSPEFYELAIIALTGSVTELSDFDLRLAGFTESYRKPLDPKLLSMIVGRLMALSIKHREESYD